MLEYSLILGNNLRDAWAGQILPLIDMIRSSAYFWPGVAAAGIAIAVLIRLISR